MLHYYPDYTEQERLAFFIFQENIKVLGLTNTGSSEPADDMHELEIDRINNIYELRVFLEGLDLSYSKPNLIPTPNDNVGYGSSLLNEFIKGMPNIPSRFLRPLCYGMVFE